ncbi:hypothetical protein D3C84_510200 [compost metagenome]
MHHQPLRVVDFHRPGRLHQLAVAVHRQFGQLIRGHRHPVLAVMALQVDDAETVAPAAAVHRVIEANDEQVAGHFLVDFRQAQRKTPGTEQALIDQNVQALATREKDFEAVLRHAHAGQLADQFLAAGDGLAEVILAVDVEIQRAAVADLVAVARQLGLGAVVDHLVQREDGEFLRALRFGQLDRVLFALAGEQEPSVMFRALIVVVHGPAPAYLLPLTVPKRSSFSRRSNARTGTAR